MYTHDTFHSIVVLVIQAAGPINHLVWYAIKCCWFVFLQVELVWFAFYSAPLRTAAAQTCGPTFFHRNIRFGLNAALIPVQWEDSTGRFETCNYLHCASLQHSENLPVHTNATRQSAYHLSCNDSLAFLGFFFYMWIYFIFTSNMNEQSNSELLPTVAFVVLMK